MEPKGLKRNIKPYWTCLLAPASEENNFGIIELNR